MNDPFQKIPLKLVKDILFSLSDAFELMSDLKVFRQHTVVSQVFFCLFALLNLPWKSDF